MIYKIILLKEALKSFSKLPLHIKIRIKANLKNLSEGKINLNIAYIKNSNGLYRIRCSKYRVVFSKDNDTYIIFVIDIGKREDIYKLLKSKL
jgi:mRNA interferase RelE/StbE